jgi:sphinganine-1-phosphate aldolase
LKAVDGSFEIGGSRRDCASTPVSNDWYSKDRVGCGKRLMNASADNHMSLPMDGMEESELFRRMAECKEGDADWRRGRIWGLVYHATDELVELQSKVYKMFFHENALGPWAFPSVRTFEAHVVSMITEMLRGGPEAAGTMTSGGTESILLAVKAHRDYYRKRGPDRAGPEMILPVTAHPAFLKAARYFDIKVRRIPVDSEYRADPAAIEAAINKNTIMLGASAPSYPQGVVDPIPELGQMALAYDLGLHVDSCLGGFILPFLRKEGWPVPEFDLSLPGVTSISVDLHKYGYAAKGAGAIIYRNHELRANQFFIETDWPGGLFASPTMLGTRSAGIIASAWAIMMRLGENGYRNLAVRTVEAARKMRDSINEIPDLEVVGCPDMSVFSIASPRGTIFAIAGEMEKRGWRMNLQKHPDSIHIIVTSNHIKVIDEFLEDLKYCSSKCRTEGFSGIGKRPMVVYGKVSEGLDKDATSDDLIRVIEENYTIG